MSVLYYIDTLGGDVKKSSHEIASYAAAVANQLGTEAIGVALGSASNTDLAALGEFGATKVLHIADAGLDNFDSGTHASALAELAKANGANVVVFSQSSRAKAVAPRLAVKLEAGYVSGAVSVPETANGFVVKKSAYSGKAFANVQINTENKIIGLASNSYGAKAGAGSATVEATSANVAAGKVNIVKTNTDSDAAGGMVPLPEAELVVSAGRGLKGPENWGIIEDLAAALGATTACSRPVADSGWRPHHEHVGQTGVAIHPNLYIAIGISGAIQHLAGVNQSKVIVVINKDPEAPFFKAADYGVVGDAFEVIPRLTEAVKKFKQG
ncbi:MAG: electron transfer flavoprotein subunit alpha/FixB family protein [Chitinophagales bacterium]|nr:electron transfer flavoprotein subunit alpha/FixB family protein [Chitinophagales bacterium]